MKALSPNPETGFLESSASSIGPLKRVIFDSNRKVHFLKLAKEYIEQNNHFPSIHAICKTVGVSIASFEAHLKQDERFKEAWEEVKSILKSVYTSKLAVKADSKNGIVANLAILKYLETGSFVDRIQVNSYSNTQMIKRVKDSFSDAIDAEIVENSQQLTDNRLNNESD